LSKLHDLQLQFLPVLLRVLPFDISASTNFNSRSKSIISAS
jgi:hypothetical protein